MWLKLTRTDGVREFETMVNFDLVTRIEKNVFKPGTHIVFGAGNYMDVTESFDDITSYL